MYLGAEDQRGSGVEQTYAVFTGNAVSANVETLPLHFTHATTLILGAID